MFNAANPKTRCPLADKCELHTDKPVCENYSNNFRNYCGQYRKLILH